MKLIDIIKKNAELELKLVGKRFKIAVISNITVNLIKQVLELTLREEGINAEVIIGDYDSIVQDSKKFSECKTVIIFWETSNLIDGFQNVTATSEVLEKLIQKVENEIDFVFENLSNCPLVLFNRFSSFIFEVNPLKKGILDSVSKRLNEKIERKKEILKNIVTVDLDLILARAGIKASYDARNFLSSKSLYTLDFYKEYANSVKPAFSSVFGGAKKVLILDCDNTLWGGIIGEDGFDGIHMSDISPKGKAFKEVQQLILNLQKAGVLVALCSKNNFDDVDKVIMEHPDFLFKDSDIIAKKINWEDKSSNIKQLSIELNLGLDSFVFIDDSKFEIGLIEKELPEVKCFLVPNNISEYPSYFRDISSIFYSTVNSKEDNRKTELYKTEEIRKNIASKFESIEEYLISLDLELTIMWDKDISIERVAQLTQKTNQFNLTTRRYSENEIRIMLTNPNFKVASFSLSDKYGDYGVVGVSIIKIIANKEIGNKAIIDTFLMSCRVIGRNVEFAFFQQIALKLTSENISTIEAEFIATPKNQQVKEFYPSLGFSITNSTNENLYFSLEITNSQKITNVNYFKIK